MKYGAKKFQFNAGFFMSENICNKNKKSQTEWFGLY
jgi:hypothetical protein